ncbi:EAL domain-containing protein [Burkholderia vietnamiensis]|uniref:EAL domain-containing protein n=1 Tax=Burkholderia vietnamiensis TaxID=60552 RepID=UPI00075B8F2D|nr:EAL domain-containing protein [Burkholderia vietnamiensis]KVF35028.1 hypothetical protein WJ08_04115 [Burkholderia vietnamiensis]KVF42657.1 hypothetical protein WJ10_01060 [Burkholderia vietnamiensis]
MTDMRVAEQIWDAMRTHRIQLHFARIHRADDPNDVLYRECLARIPVADGQWRAASALLPALTRLNLVSTFERYVLRRVIQFLRDHPDEIVGVNFQCDGFDSAWTAALLELEVETDVAKRLIVEVPETSHVSREFVQFIRRAGCRIAIDGYGVAYGMRADIAIGHPDIVKFDPSLLTEARQADAGLEQLSRLIRLASDVATEAVVLTGVRGPQDLSVAARAGAPWVQPARDEPGAP